MLNHSGTPVLTTPRLVLRPYREGDGDAMFENWAHDPENLIYVTWDRHETVETSRKIIADWVTAYQNPACLHWGITIDGELTGDIAVMRWSEKNEDAEIGYIIGRKWWNKGYMTEALRAVTAYLFDQAGFHRVMLRHDTQNVASGRVMQKAGFQYEGCMRESLMRRDGTFGDLNVYGALRGEWK